MNYEALRNSISAAIKTNGEQRITGAVLQEVLLNMVSSLGQYASYAGIANPGTNPAGIDGNVFYIATAPGNYQYFGFTISTSGYYIISNLSGAWNLVRLPIIADSATYAGGISVSGYNGVEIRARKIAGDSDDIELYSSDEDFFVYVYGAEIAQRAISAGDAYNLGGIAASMYLTKSDAAATYQPLITDTNKLPYSLLIGTPTIPTNNNQLTNGAGYINAAYVQQYLADNDYAKKSDITAQAVGLGNVQNTAFYTRSVDVNGEDWAFASPFEGQAFSIFAPTTAGTSGQVLVSTGATPSWQNIAEVVAASVYNLQVTGGQGDYVYVLKNGNELNIVSSEEGVSVGVDIAHTASYDNEGNYIATTYQPLATAINTGNIASQSVAALNLGSVITTQEELDAFNNGVSMRIAPVRNVLPFPPIVSSDGLVISIPWQNTTFGAQLAVDDQSNVMLLRTRANNVWLDWRTIAFTDSDITGNAGSATKLQTTRTIWGQPFDGTGDVNGNLTVPTINGGTPITSSNISSQSVAQATYATYIGDSNDRLGYQSLNDAIDQITDLENAVESLPDTYQPKITATNKLPYSLLSGTPTIPTNTNQLTNGAGYINAAYVQQYLADNNYAKKSDITAQAVGLGNVQNTAFYTRSVDVNGEDWAFASPFEGQAFSIFAPTTAGTSGQVLVSTGGTPSWASSVAKADSATYATYIGDSNDRLGYQSLNDAIDQITDLENAVESLPDTYQPKITATNKLPYSLLSDTPTSLPASDVYAWAKAATKPTYSFSEITDKPTTLSGYGITDNVAYRQTWNDFIHDTNEFTFAAPAYSGVLLINYRTASGHLDGAITEYRFCKGAGTSCADIRAAKYIVYGGTSSQFLKADGGLDSTTYQPLATAINTGNIGSQSVAALNLGSLITTQEELDAFNDGVSMRISPVRNVLPSSIVSQDGLVISIPWANTTFGAQLAVDDQSNVMLLRTRANNVWLDWRTIAFTDSNVASALELTDSNGNVTYTVDDITAIDNKFANYSPLEGSASLTKYSGGNFGNAAAKNYTTSVQSGNANLVTSGAVYTAIDDLRQEVRVAFPSMATLSAYSLNGSVLNCYIESEDNIDLWGDLPAGAVLFVVIQDGASIEGTFNKISAKYDGSSNTTEIAVRQSPGLYSGYGCVLVSTGSLDASQGFISIVYPVAAS